MYDNPPADPFIAGPLMRCGSCKRKLKKKPEEISWIESMLAAYPIVLRLGVLRLGVLRLGSEQAAGKRRPARSRPHSANEFKNGFDIGEAVNPFETPNDTSPWRLAMHAPSRCRVVKRKAPPGRGLWRINPTKRSPTA